MQASLDHLVDAAVSLGIITRADANTLIEEHDMETAAARLLPNRLPVQLFGLTGRPALNGCDGMIIGSVREGRVPVRVQLGGAEGGHEDVRVRPANLKLVGWARLPWLSTPTVSEPLQQFALPHLDLKSLLAFSQCSRAALALVDEGSTERLNVLFRELKEQHGHVALEEYASVWRRSKDKDDDDDDDDDSDDSDDDEPKPFLSSTGDPLSPRARLCTGIRIARRHIERVTQYIDWRLSSKDYKAHYSRKGSVEKGGHFTTRGSISSYRLGFEPDEETSADHTHWLDLKSLFATNKPRYDLMQTLNLLHLAREDIQGAHYHVDIRSSTGKTVRGAIDEYDDDFAEDFEASYYFADDNAPWCGPDEGGVLQPSTGSSFNQLWHRKLFEDFDTPSTMMMMSAGERTKYVVPHELHHLSSFAGGDGPGSDAHLEHLLHSKPEMLSPNLWGDAAIDHLDVVNVARSVSEQLTARLTSLKRRPRLWQPEPMTMQEMFGF